MIGTFTLLLLFQLAGELLVRLFHWPFPGPVIGMALLFLTLLVRGTVSHELRAGTAGLLQHLLLLFVPAGVGVMTHWQHLTSEWLPITVAVLVSTLIGLVVTVWVIILMAGDKGSDQANDASGETP